MKACFFPPVSSAVI
uniref:Uncharacterized protein n=1 Tax=Anguilla anguilla TaxID=7936 RepID=A0A0E9UBD1_ANGAN